MNKFINRHQRAAPYGAKFFENVIYVARASYQIPGISPTMVCGQHVHATCPYVQASGAIMVEHLKAGDAQDLGKFLGVS